MGGGEMGINTPICNRILVRGTCCVFCYRRTCWVCAAIYVFAGCSVTDILVMCVLLHTYILRVLIQMYMIRVFCYRRTCWVCFASDEGDREAE